MASSDIGAGGGSTTGGSGGGGGPFSRPPRSDGPGVPSGQERTVSYQPEERYWTDYLRIALPLLGLIILFGVFWYWGNALIGGGNDDEPTPTTAALADVSEVNASPPAATATAPPAAIAPTPGPALTSAPADQQPAADATEPPTAGDERPADGETEEAPPEEASSGSTTIPVREVGSTALTDGVVNVREEPSAESTQVQELEDGTSVTIAGDQVDDREGGPNEWYPVELVDGTTGFIREDLFQP